MSIQVETFLKQIGAEFYTGVPDSQLKPLCDYLENKYGSSDCHIIAANEGNCTAIAAGYHLATGKIPVVYMQNSGIGNMLNPAASLLHPKVYGIPCVFIIGWRGEPGCPDEPQHVFQGEITERLLADLDISTFIVEEYTTEDEISHQMENFRSRLSLGQSVAFMIKKGALSYHETVKMPSQYPMTREFVIEKIVEHAANEIVVCSTGKASRELFEIRERKGQPHTRDFLTVGSMGHSSSISLGISLYKTGTRVWCVDGDGAAIMHMGSMAIVGSRKPSDMIHIILNNGVHDTVGGMPTAGFSVDFVKIALGCGYPRAFCATSPEQLETCLREAESKNVLTLLEVRCRAGARTDLGRPTIPAILNKENFMECVGGLR